MKDADIIEEERLRRAIDSRVKFNHLRVFLEVTRHESVSKAAAAMHLAQPAVTKTLREFEEILGVELFARHARGTVLNEAGRLIIPHVRAIFADRSRIADQINAYRQGVAGSITIGATASALPYLLPRSLASETVKNRGGVVHVIEGSIDQMSRALSGGELDLVVGRILTAIDNDLLVQEIVFEDPFVPVVGKRHDLAHVSGDALPASANYPWIFPPFGSSAAEPLGIYLLQNNIHPQRKLVETVSYATILSLLATTDCVAILPQHIARVGERTNTLSIIGPALQQGRLMIGLTFRRDHPLSPLGQSFAEAFRHAARSITD